MLNAPADYIDPAGLFLGPSNPGDICGGGGVAPGPGGNDDEDKPGPSCTVFVDIKPIKGLPGKVFDHSFLVTQDNQTGVQWYAGARSSKFESAGLGGVLVGTFALFTAEFSLDFDKPLVASFDVTFFDQNCDAINRSFEASKNRINAQAYPYDPSDLLYGTNSNAFSYSLLTDYGGLKMLKLIAKVSAWEAIVTTMQPDPIPGWFHHI